VRVIGHVKRSRALRRVAREIFFQRKYEQKKKRKEKKEKWKKTAIERRGKEERKSETAAASWI